MEQILAGKLMVFILVTLTEQYQVADLRPHLKPWQFLLAWAAEVPFSVVS